MRFLENDYRLSNKDVPLNREEIQKALTDFPYFAAHYQQIVNKRRQTVPSALNFFQQKLAKILLPMIHPETRLDRRHNVVILKPRQVGASTFTVEFINYLCAFVEGLNHMNILHFFPVGDTVSKFYKDKVIPIITGVHPSLFPTMERKAYTTSITTTYHNIKGIPRDNVYELVSAGASSVRSATCNIAIMDECYTGDVEILTDQGFKRLDSLDHTELVAQYDCSNDGISFVEPLRYIDREYNGDAYEWELCGNKFITTALHAFVQGRRGEGSKGRPKYKRTLACNMQLTENWDYPTFGFGVAEHQPLTALERLGIAVQADGYVQGTRQRASKNSGTKGGARCRISLKRPCKIRRLERLLEEAGIPYSMSAERGGSYKTYRFDLPYENPKLLPSFLSLNCSYRRAREILHEVLHWDGYGLDRETLNGEAYLPKNSYYSSVVEQNRDFVAAIALQAGQQVTTTVQVDNRSETHSDMYRLYMNARRNRSCRNFKRTAINYQGRVYCVEVPSGCIVVRTGKEVWVCGNCAHYRNPEELEAAVSPAIPDFGFSLVIYLSTFDDAKSSYFMDKIKEAQGNSEDWTLLFTPWYEMYPEEFWGTDFNSLILTEYDTNTILPALKLSNIPEERYADCITWYHKKAKECLAIQKEYPTTIQEVLAFGTNSKVFDQKDLEAQAPNLIERKPYTLVSDVLTNKIEARESKSGPLSIFKPPVYGGTYLISIDPITSISESSDYFAASVWDTRTHEQMAVLHGKNLPLEDWATLTLQLARLYNRAVLCPESNVAQALVVLIWGQGYYNWFWASESARKNREPGLRTTVTSKPDMIEKLAVMLRNRTIILHDQETLEELKQFELVEKRGYTKMQAPKGKHDDLVMSTVLYAGTLGTDQLAGIKKSGWAICGI